MTQTIKPSEVLAVKRWLLTADELEPEGWERELLIVVKDGDSPYSFFISRVEPREEEEHGRTRYCATWCHDLVLVGAAPSRAGRNVVDSAGHDTLPQARSRLRAMFEEVTGSSTAGFEEAFKEGNALFKDLKQHNKLR